MCGPKAFSSALIIFATFGTALSAQGLYSELLHEGTLVGSISETFFEGLEKAREEYQFEDPEQCLRSLQAVVNLGAMLSDVMPFSKVETLEDSRGPVGKLRVMLNGNQIHTEVFCVDRTFQAAELPWGAGDEAPVERHSPSFASLAEVVMNPHLQSIFASNIASANPTGESIGQSGLGVANNPRSAPPMTSAEREGFRSAVNDCWEPDTASDSSRVQTTVSFNLDKDGKVDGDIRQIASSGGDENEKKLAFEAARKAILTCQGSDGYNLPVSKYGDWSEVELTFDPSGLRMR